MRNTLGSFHVHKSPAEMTGMGNENQETSDKVRGHLVGSRRISEEEYLQCTRCGLCSYTCPSYRARLTQANSPRGRVALLRSAIQGELKVGKDFGDKFYGCTLCAACDEVCPSGVKVEQLLFDVREELAKRNLLPPSLEQLSRTVRETHNISGEDNSLRLIWTENMERPPLGTEKETAEVVYFVGCVSSLFPRSYSIPQAFVEILEVAAVDYTLLGANERCCGYPLLVNGMLTEARESILHNVAHVRATGARRIVFTCPSCYHIWKHVYPEIAGDALDDMEILHASELVAELVDEARLHLSEMNLTVTYHDPCDLGRKSNVYEAPRRILRSIPGLTLVEMADNRENALCCGGGGNLETHDRDLVSEIARRRLAQAQVAGAQAIVSACQQCERTLVAAARQDRVRLRVLDVVEIVRNALNR